MKRLMVLGCLLASGLSATAYRHAPLPTRIACVAVDRDGRPTAASDLDDLATCVEAQLKDGGVIRVFGRANADSGQRATTGDSPHWTGLNEFVPHIAIVVFTPTATPDFRLQTDSLASNVHALLHALRRLPGEPRVLLSLPEPPIRPTPAAAKTDNQVILALRQIAFDERVELLDLHTPFLDKAAWFASDGKPDERARALTARLVTEISRLHVDHAFDVAERLTRMGYHPALLSFHGYRELDFTISDGHACRIVCPYVTANDRLFVWRAEFFGHEPQTELALLERGYHVVYVDTRDLFGAPVAMRIWENYYMVLRTVGLNGKIVLLGMSRGGLFCYHWAARHPKTVTSIYCDAPVCDVKSWPLCLGRSQAGRGELSKFLAAYGFHDEAEAKAYHRNPIDVLASLAAAHIPIIHVIGEADVAAPVEENSDILERRYRALGGTIMVIRKPGAGHHPHSLANPQPIVDFIIDHRS